MFEVFGQLRCDRGFVTGIEPLQSLADLPVRSCAPRRR
jgi:hypothetical protein